MSETTLTEEARQAMEGITGEPWVPVASEDRHHMSWVCDPTMPEGAQNICLVGAIELDVEQANTEFIAWCGNGGVRRLVERIEELEARDAGS